MEQRPLYAVVDYEAKVGDSVFAVPFPYIEKAHVFVYVDDYPVNFTWLSDNSVQLQNPLPEDATVRVRRQTPLDRRLVDFQSASVLTEKDLDVSNLQVFFNQQEVEDDLYLGLLGYDVSNLKGDNGDYIEQRFMWAVEAPDTPTPFDPQPFGWLPAIPEEPENDDPLIQYHLWMTQCWKDGSSGQCQTIWSRPVRLTGNDAERLDLKDGWIRREHFEAELAAQIELDYTALNEAQGLAEAARDEANLAAQNAQAAQASAEQAQATANQAVADASQALTDANTLKADAQAAAQAALEQAGLAEASRGAAVIAATDAQGYAQAALVSKNTVQDLEAGIQANAQAAALAATDAEGNAMAALTAKTDAVQAKDEAILAADAAVVAKTDAEGNASAALAASTEAKTYRDQAKTSADAAVLAKTDAEGSAEAALVAKTTVETLQGQVETDAQAAATAKTDAEGAATAALTAKSEATDAATNASTSAQAAATAATTAEGHAQAALTAKTDAENSAEAAVLAETNAEGHAQSALTAKTDAEDAAQAAVLAKTDAEGNATSALTARTQAQGHADDAAASASSAATDAQAAIQAKTDAEGYASSALVAKSEAEDAANAAKTDAIAAAQSKADAEGNASASLVAQTNAENAQAAAENARDAAVNAKNAAVTAQTASVQAKTDAEGHASAALTAQSEASNYSADALAYRNTSKTYRDQAMSYRDSASDSAAIATSQANAAIQAKTEAGESAELVSQVSLVQGIIMDFWEGNVSVGLADDYASATSKFTLTSDSEGKAALRVQLVDAEGGGVIAFNGEIIDQGFRGADQETKWYEYVVDAQLGDNEVAIWRATTDGITLKRIELRGGDQDTKFNAVEERLRANEDEAYYSLKVQADGKVAGIGAIADPLGTAILFQADQIGFTHDTGADIYPFTVRDGVVYIDKARMVTLESNSIINVESVYNTEKKAVLGNTTVEGKLTLNQDGQILWKDLDPEFRDRLVMRSSDSTITGGSRSNVGAVIVGNLIYAAQNGNTNKPPITSGGKYTEVIIRVNGGVGFGEGRDLPVSSPQCSFTVKRKNLATNVTETLGSHTFYGSTHAEDTIPKTYFSTIYGSHKITPNLASNGDDYEYWLEVTARSGDWGLSDGFLTIEVTEEVGSSDSLVVNTEWNLIQNKPETATRWPTFNEVSGKPATATRWPSWSEVTSKPSQYTPTAHTHSFRDVDFGGSFDINGSGASAQENGIYATSVTDRGTTENPQYTIILSAQNSTSRSIHLSVDGNGYLWGMRSHSNSGTYKFQSKVKDSDKLGGVAASSYALKPNDHTSNNSEYHMVWENRSGDLYTSGAHLMYNPALRRITTGAIRLDGNDTIETTSGDLRLNPNGMVNINGGVRLGTVANDILQVTNSNGWVRVGANNTGYAHLYTDRPWFYTDKGIRVDGTIQVYNKMSQFTGDGNHALIGATSSYFTRISNNGDIARINTGWANNATEQKILRNSYASNVGDYIQIQPSGNRTTNGALVIGTNSFGVGLHDLGGVEGNTRIPFTDTWLSVDTTDFWLSGKRVIRHSDSWLRLNEDKSFSSGIYCGGSTLRTDGNLQVGSSGNAFNANTNQIDLKVTTRVHNKLHVREIVSQDGNFTTIGAGELGNSLRQHVIDTYGTGSEGLHLGGEHGVWLYSHPNNMTGGMAAAYSIRPIASDGATYINHLDVYKDQNNANQLVARFRHPNQNTNVAIVAKNQNKGSFRFEANADGGDLRIQTADTSGDYKVGGGDVGTIAHFYRSGTVKIRGLAYAKSHGSGTMDSPVMTHGDFLPDQPPAGLEGAITSPWISAGAVNAKHLQVNGGTNAANGSKRSFKIAPDDPRPLHFATLNDDLTVKEDIFYVEASGDAYFAGKLSKDTVDINSIQEEARKQINPHYLGTVAGGRQQKSNVTLTSGQGTALAAVSTIGGKVNINFKLSASSAYLGGIAQNYTAPDWTIELRRDSASGTVLFSKRYTGTVNNWFEKDVGLYESNSNLIVDEVFTDTSAPASEVYYVRVVRHGGTPTEIKVLNFEAESPAFVTNQLKSSGTIDVFWEKETGYMITTGRHFVNEDQELNIAFPYTYNDVHSATISGNVNFTNGTSDAHNIYVDGLTTNSITITNGDEYSNGQYIYWQVTGRRTNSI